MKIHLNQIKSVTNFIIEKSLIFHPVISPKGTPDFSNYDEKEYVLIIDRNIMTKIVELCNTGTLKDRHILNVISSIMFWSELNNISITGGLALNEYANIKKDDTMASIENNVFLTMFNQYSIETWLDLYGEKITKVPKINFIEEGNYNFDVKNSHQKMHLAEVLHIFYLLMNKNLSNTEKMIDLLQWIDKNILFCKYTIVYAALLFSKQIKQPKSNELNSIDRLLKKSTNQAWDLTYLSFWSTLYMNENRGNTVHLFATMDKDLKRIFINTHDVETNLFIKCFGLKEGTLILEHYEDILKNRIKPNITDQLVSELINSEINRLEKFLEK